MPTKIIKVPKAVAIYLKQNRKKVAFPRAEISHRMNFPTTFYLFKMVLDTIPKHAPDFYANVKFLIEQVDPKMLLRVLKGNPSWVTTLIESRLKNANAKRGERNARQKAD